MARSFDSKLAHVTRELQEELAGLVDPGRYQLACAAGSGAFGPREFLATQSLGHSPCEEQAIECSLIFGQHWVGRTGGKAHTHPGESTRAISSYCFYQS